MSTIVQTYDTLDLAVKGLQEWVDVVANSGILLVTSSITPTNKTTVVVITYKYN